MAAMTSNLVIMYERSIFAKIGAKVSSPKTSPIPATGQIKPEKTIDLTKLESDFQRIVVKPYSTALHLSAIWGDIFVNPIPSLESLLKKSNEPLPIIFDQSDHIIQLKSRYSDIKTPVLIDLLKSPMDTPDKPHQINLLKSPMDTPGQQKFIDLLKSPIDVPGKQKNVDLLTSPIATPGSPKSIDLLKSPIDSVKSPNAVDLLKSPMDATKPPKDVNLLYSPMDAPLPPKDVNLEISPTSQLGTTPGFSIKNPADSYVKDSEYYILLNDKINKIDTPKNQITLALPVKVDGQGKQSKVTRHGLYSKMFAFDLDNRVGVLNEYRQWSAAYRDMPVQSLFTELIRLPAVRFTDVSLANPYSQPSAATGINTPLIDVDKLVKAPIGFGRDTNVMQQISSDLVKFGVDLAAKATDIVSQQAESSVIKGISSLLRMDSKFISTATESGRAWQALAGPIFQKVHGLPPPPADTSDSFTASSILSSGFGSGLLSGAIASVVNKLIGRTLLSKEKVLMIAQVLMGTKYTAGKAFVDPQTHSYSTNKAKHVGEVAYNDYDAGNDYTRYTVALPDTPLTVSVEGQSIPIGGSSSPYVIQDEKVPQSADNLLYLLRSINASNRSGTVTDKYVLAVPDNITATTDGQPPYRLKDSQALLATAFRSGKAPISTDVGLSAKLTKKFPTVDDITTPLNALDQGKTANKNAQASVATAGTSTPNSLNVVSATDLINKIPPVLSPVGVTPAVDTITQASKALTQAGIKQSSLTMFKNVGNSDSTILNYYSNLDVGTAPASKNNMLQFVNSNPLGVNFQNNGVPQANTDYPQRYGSEYDANIGATGDEPADKYSDRLAAALDKAGEKDLSDRGFPSRATDFLDAKNAMDLMQIDTPDKSTDRPYNDFDLIDFYFEDISSEPNQSILIPFRAIITSFSDSTSADWNPFQYVGRPDKFYVYQGFDRKVEVQFDVAVESKAELLPTWRKLNYLNGMCYPVAYPARITMKPPIVAVTIGSLLQRVPAIMQAFTFSLDGQAIWELQKNFQMPMYIRVSLDFTILFSDIPIHGAKHFAQASDWIAGIKYPIGKVDNTVNSPSTAKQKFSNANPLVYKFALEEFKTAANAQPATTATAKPSTPVVKETESTQVIDPAWKPKEFQAAKSSTDTFINRTTVPSKNFNDVFNVPRQ